MRTVIHLHKIYKSGTELKGKVFEVFDLRTNTVITRIRKLTLEDAYKWAASTYKNPIYKIGVRL